MACFSCVDNVTSRTVRRDWTHKIAYKDIFQENNLSLLFWLTSYYLLKWEKLASKYLLVLFQTFDDSIKWEDFRKKNVLELLLSLKILVDLRCARFVRIESETTVIIKILNLLKLLNKIYRNWIGLLTS